MTTLSRRPSDAPRPAPSVSFTLPRADRDLLDWMQAAVSLFRTDPARYQLACAPCEKLDTLVRAFHDAYQFAQSPHAGRSHRQMKDEARDAARAAFAPVIQQIKSDPMIDLESKLALGFKPIAPRSPIDPPATSPVLSIVEAGDGRHKLRFADRATPDTSRKPRGAHTIELRIFTVDGPPARLPPSPDEAAAESLGIPRTHHEGRSPFTIEHTRTDAGRTAVYYARWLTRSNKPGPWSPPADVLWMTIAVAGRGDDGKS